MGRTFWAFSILLVPLLALPANSEDIRERLTEREDENRVEDPWTTEVFGHPLSFSGELDVSLEATDPIRREDSPDGDRRLRFEPEIEAELFYTLGEPLSILFQVRAGFDWDVLAGTRQGNSDFFLERGEMWIDSEDILGSGLGVSVGRLDFDDDRVWWWDEELDAVRVEYEGPIDASLAVAYPLGRTRSDTRFLDPEEEDRLLFLGELSWEWSEEQSLEWYFLLERDRSGDRQLGQIVDNDRIDETDGRLFWMGPRAIGGFELGQGTLGYWLDAAVVKGTERLVEFEDLQPGRSIISGVERRDVLGWAFDLGVTYFLPGKFEPRGTVGIAMGSGDENPDGRKDHAFRQTGLQGNENGFGGVQRFASYGRLLDPELSNLVIVTAGVGISLFESSSMDLVYHYYQLHEQADELRDAALETAFDGRHRDVGHGLDLTLALEEWDRFELEIAASAFRAGSAWASRSGQWAFGGFLSARVAF